LTYIGFIREIPQTGDRSMPNIMPDGDDLRNAVKWVSANIQEEPDQPVQPLVQQAIFKFDLSPKDAEFLIGFYGRKDDENELQPAGA
jgi:hypothetical protein